MNALPEEVWERLVPGLECVALSAGQVVYASGAPVHDAYFPTSSIFSMHCLLENGSTAQVAMVGRDGMVGLSLFLGAERSMSQISVQTAGQAFRLPAHVLHEEFGRGGALMQVLLRYTQFFINQMVQSAACNQHGTIEQRLCRWLLLSLDRLPGGELSMTHESIANALSVRREGISEAAARLQRQGAIHYHRGHIDVVDRPALERGACECYRMEKSGMDRIQFGPPARGDPESAQDLKTRPASP
ncbi:MAG: Crp/Fnr family transcriptional regulator [Burkholderiaceae bacterium]